MEIVHADYLISSPSIDKCPAPDKPEYAFFGRSNVGKSSLINMLTNKKELAKISSTQRKTWQKMIEEYIKKRETLVNLFVLIDSRHEPQKLDLEFINRLGSWKIPF